jgi:hypothetical protein
VIGHSDYTPMTQYGSSWHELVINFSTQQSPTLRLCSASWGWASNAQNMSRLWTSKKSKEKCVSSWYCLIRNYEYNSYWIILCFRLTHTFMPKIHMTFYRSSVLLRKNVLMLTRNKVHIVLSHLLFNRSPLHTCIIRLIFRDKHESLHIKIYRM